MSTAEEKTCKRNLIPAYIDGELDEHLTQLFEAHMDSCARCRTELRAHRLFVCELDAALTENVEIPVPADFSRIVATRATTDMRGVRTRSENKKALGICLLLALGGFALLGATARDAMFMLVEKSFTSVLGLAGFISTAVYDIVAGLAVIFRVLSRKIIIESGSLGPMIVLLVLAIVVLRRLISNYHRPGATG
jgi:hypothetical protein